MYCVETKNLSYRFSSKEPVLDSIDLKVPKGSIYGFLGPNGAGKTTTLKLILGLLRCQSGMVHLFGLPFEANRIALLQKTGSLIEAPSMYSQLSAAANLAVLQKIYQCPKARIADVLDIVGLTAAGNKKAGKFSLGMKQRLSIGMALLHEPSLLILDEPTNGLDPAGIIEIRELLKALNRELGITIIISSHLLSEIEKVATHAGIIHKGRILFQGTLSELQLRQTQSAATGFITSDILRTMDVLTAEGMSPQVKDGQVVVPQAAKTTITKINQLLLDNHIEVYQISTVSNDLESIFIDLTNNN